MPTVVPTDSRPLSWPPIGALPRNRLASSATGSASPISPTPRLLHSLKRFRRAGCPHPADPDLHRTPCKNHVIARPVRKLAWQSVIPLRPPMPPAAPFLSAAKEREERTPPKPMVQESFPRLKRRLYRPPFAPRIGLCKIYAVLSYRLCVPIRAALCACAGLAKQGKPLRLLRGGVRTRRPTQSQKLDSVGADDPVAVPKISMLPCGCRMKF